MLGPSFGNEGTKRLGSLCYNIESILFSNQNAMKILALLVATYAGVMLVIHVSTAKILNVWKEQRDSWISRWFPPRRALRTEALFWILALAAWPLWSALAVKILVVIFAAIHLVAWGAGEFRRNNNNVPLSSASHAVRRAIVTFDLIEALFLSTLGVLATMYLSRAR